MTDAVRRVVRRFNDAFAAHDVNAVMAMMTDDCVFESTGAPDGSRYVGQDAVRQVWIDFFAGSPHAHFTEEDSIASGDRCIVLWLYDWTDAAGRQGHVRGVDVMRVRDGKIAEKLTYVKG